MQVMYPWVQVEYSAWWHFFISTSKDFLFSNLGNYVPSKFWIYFVFIYISKGDRSGHTHLKYFASWISEKLNSSWSAYTDQLKRDFFLFTVPQYRSISPGRSALTAVWNQLASASHFLVSQNSATFLLSQIILTPPSASCPSGLAGRAKLVNLTQT